MVDTQPYRSGVTVTEDERLVPFGELVRELDAREGEPAPERAPEPDPREPRER